MKTLLVVLVLFGYIPCVLLGLGLGFCLALAYVKRESDSINDHEPITMSFDEFMQWP